MSFFSYTHTLCPRGWFLLKLSFNFFLFIMYVILSHFKLFTMPLWLYFSNAFSIKMHFYPYPRPWLSVFKYENQSQKSNIFKTLEIKKSGVSLISLIFVCRFFIYLNIYTYSDSWGIMSISLAILTFFLNNKITCDVRNKEIKVQYKVQLFNNIFWHTYYYKISN